MAKYYVDPVNGSDAAAGASFATAWKSTAYAVSQAVQDDTIALCATGEETLTSSVTISGKNIFLVGHNAAGVNDGTLYQIRGPAGAAVFITRASYYSNIEVLLDSTTPSSPFSFSGGGTIFVHNCKSIGIINYIFYCGTGENVFLIISNSTFKNTTASLGFNSANRGLISTVVNSVFENCVVLQPKDLAGTVQINNCVFLDTAILQSIYNRHYIQGSIFWGSEILLGDRDSAYMSDIITNCVLGGVTATGKAAIRWSSTANKSPLLVDNCLFYGNTNDIINASASFFLGPGCITGIDPGFTDPDNGDFSYSPDSPLFRAAPIGATGEGITVDIGCEAATYPTPAAIAAAIWARTGRTLTS